MNRRAFFETILAAPLAAKAAMMPPAYPWKTLADLAAYHYREALESQLLWGHSGLQIPWTPQYVNYPVGRAVKWYRR